MAQPQPKPGWPDPRSGLCSQLRARLRSGFALLKQITPNPAVWLLLPLIGLGVWLTTTWMTDWVLSNADSSSRQLQTSFYPTSQLNRTLTVSSIVARIDRSDQITEVTLLTRDSTLKRLEFKLPLVEPPDLEQALVKELNTTAGALRPLIQYQVR